MATMDLSGRSVVVVGAGGGGIGTAVCRTIAEAGGNVCAVDLDADALPAVETALSGTAGTHQYLAADAGTPEQVGDVVDRAAAGGDLYGLVHVAGGVPWDQWGSIRRTEPVVFERLVHRNLTSAFTTARAVASRLDGGGSIVLVSSATGLAALPYGAGYSAAKAGMMSLTRTAAVEWGRQGIRVNSVAPGSVQLVGVDALPGQAETVPLGELGVPDDIAHAALFLLSDLSRWITGQVLVVDGGTSVWPRWLNSDNMPFVVGADPERRARLLANP